MAQGNYGVFFNGRHIVHPGAYERQDASAMTISSPGSVNVPIIVGTAEAGEPGKVKWFSDPRAAREYLRGGDLPIAVDMMFSPAPEGGGGASMVGVLIANENEQASLNAGGIKFLAKEYGEGGNRIQVKVDDGTVRGSKAISVQRWDLNMTETYDNLGTPIRIAYKGDDPYAVVSVEHNDLNEAERIVIKTGVDQEDNEVDLKIELDDSRFVGIDDLVTFINSQSNYEASLVNYISADLHISKLDEMDDVDISDKGSYLTSSKGDFELVLSNYSNLIEAEVTSSVENLDNFRYLTGGTKGKTPTSWTTYFDTIKSEFSDILVVLSGSEAIHAEASVHVQQMENRGQKQTLFTGGEAGETVARTKERAAVLNTRKAVLAYPGVYYKASGTNRVLAPYFTAAMIAGRVAGVDPSEPITFDQFNLVGLENDLLAGSPEVDDLITSGVATLERVQNGRIRIVEGITTYIGSNNSLYRQISVARGADDLSTKVLNRLENAFLGTRGVSTTPSSVRTEILDVLEEEKRAGSIFDYKENSIMVRFVNSVIHVDYQVAPIEPINFILITSHFVPENAVITQSEDEDIN